MLCIDDEDLLFPNNDKVPSAGVIDSDDSVLAPKDAVFAPNVSGPVVLGGFHPPDDEVVDDDPKDEDAVDAGAPKPANDVGALGSSGAFVFDGGAPKPSDAGGLGAFGSGFFWASALANASSNAFFMSLRNAL